MKIYHKYQVTCLIVLLWSTSLIYGKPIITNINKEILALSYCKGIKPFVQTIPLNDIDTEDPFYEWDTIAMEWVEKPPPIDTIKVITNDTIYIFTNDTSFGGKRNTALKEWENYSFVEQCDFQLCYFFLIDKQNGYKYQLIGEPILYDNYIVLYSNASNPSNTFDLVVYKNMADVGHKSLFYFCNRLPYVYQFFYIYQDKIFLSLHPYSEPHSNPPYYCTLDLHTFECMLRQTQLSLVECSILSSVFLKCLLLKEFGPNPSPDNFADHAKELELKKNIPTNYTILPFEGIAWQYSTAYHYNMQIADKLYILHGEFKNLTDKDILQLVLDEYNRNGLWAVGMDNSENISIVHSMLSPDAYNTATKHLDSNIDE